MGQTLPARILGNKSSRPRRVYEQIADDIRSLIVERGLTSGSRLPPERELANLFGVSRPSVREAMIALEAAGCIEVRTGDGTYVKDLAGGRAARSWGGDADPGPGPLEQFQARKLVEPELAARAAIMATKVEIETLGALVDEMADVYPTLGDFDDTLGHAFHTTLARAGRNTILAQLVEYLWDLRDSDMWKHLRRRVVNPQNRRRVVADRRNIVAALDAHDAQRARSEMTALLERAEHRYFGDGTESD